MAADTQAMAAVVAACWGVCTASWPAPPPLDLVLQGPSPAERRIRRRQLTSSPRLLWLCTPLTSHNVGLWTRRAGDGREGLGRTAVFRMRSLWSKCVDGQAV